MLENADRIKVVKSLDKPKTEITREVREWIKLSGLKLSGLHIC